MRRLKIALVSSPLAGWKAVRNKWEKALESCPDVEFSTFHWEDFAGPWRKFYEKTGKLEDIWWNLATRKACKKAISSGLRYIIITTQHNSYLVPRYRDVKYFVYGDATANQLSLMQKGVSASIRWRLFEGLLKYRTEDFTFLCMSNWYRDQLVKDLGIHESKAVLLYQGIDTDYWQPGPKSNTGVLNIIFMGRDFEWKGGHILRQLASDTRFGCCRWHYITSFKGDNTHNETFYTGLKPNSEEIVEIAKCCDISMLPTRADCSPNAVIEALSAGLPVITAPVGAIPEMVDDGRTGFLVNDRTPEAYAEKLLVYVTDRALLREHQRNARAVALDRYSIKDQIKRLLYLIKQAS